MTTTEPTKFSVRAAKGWETRRANQAAKLAQPKIAVAPAPVAANTVACACGCGQSLEVAKNPAKQKRFVQGHDAKAKSLLCEIRKGRATTDQIPAELRAAAPFVNFIQNNPVYAAYFAAPVAARVMAMGAVPSGFVSDEAWSQ